MGLRVYTLVLISSFWLSACGPGGASFQAAKGPNATGYTDPKDGLDYVTSGDPAIKARRDRNESPPAPPRPRDPKTRQPAPPPLEADRLRTRVRQFEFTRSNEAKASYQHSARFGKRSFQLIVYFRKEKQIEFNGSFGGSGNALTVNSQAGDFQLTGKITDKDQSVEGSFLLSDRRANDAVFIAYRAEKTQNTLRIDTDKKPTQGSALEKLVRQICDDKLEAVNRCQSTFGWMNNWVVENGPAFYLVDIVKQISPNDPVPDKYEPPQFAIMGESKRTFHTVKNEDGADVTEPTEVAADVLASNSGEVASAAMWANNEASLRRSFQIQVQDPNGTDTAEVSYDVESVAAIAAEQKVDPAQASRSDDTNVLPQEELTTPDETPAGGAPAAAGAAVPAIQQNKVYAFLATDMSKPRPAKMIRDFNVNRTHPGVIDFIKDFKGLRETKRAKNLRGFVSNFLKYGYWARSFAHAVANALDISPTFLLLSPGESEYLRGPKHTAATGDGGRAVGPMQIWPGTAVGWGLPAEHRKFFAPSLCAAGFGVSDFMRKNRGDSVVSVLSHNRGEPQTRKAIKFYQRKSGQFSYMYADMVRLGAVDQPRQEYVDRFLALYFITSDLVYHGFDPRVPGAEKQMPSNGSVFPGNNYKNIADPTCRQAMANLVVGRI